MRHAWIYEVIKRVPENSVAAYSVAVLTTAAATALRAGFGLMGTRVLFTSYFPAILIAALVAGRGAGIFSLVLSLLAAWWLWTQPAFVFQDLTPVQALNFSLFAMTGTLIVWLATTFRQIVLDLAANEKKRELMVAEMEHRGKNTFAVVEAIVRQALQTQPEIATGIVARIRSVSSTNDLINQSRTHSATLETILRNELAPYGPDRLRISGSSVELQADIARNLALIVHEMTTNAVKYGALSSPAGTIRVDTQVEAETVTLNWREHGGPAAVAPEAYGFGSRLIVRTVNSMGGRVEPTFSDKGFSLRITFTK